MGCGDNYGNEVTTCSFKAYGSCQGKYLLERKSVWQGVDSGRVLGQRVRRACAGSAGAGDSD